MLVSVSVLVLLFAHPKRLSDLSYSEIVGLKFNFRANFELSLVASDSKKQMFSLRPFMVARNDVFKTHDTVWGKV